MRSICCLASAALVLSLAGTASAFIAPEGAATERSPVFGGRPSAAPPSTPSHWTGWLADEVGPTIRISWNPHTGAPARIYPAAMTGPADGSTLADWIRERMNGVARRGGFAAMDLRVDDRHRVMGMDIVHLRQWVGGRPVEGSHIGAAVREGRVVWMAADCVPGLALSTPPARLDRDDAIAAALDGLGESVRLPSGGLSASEVEELVFCSADGPGGIVPRPAYAFRLPQRDGVANFRIVVSAVDGSILDVHDTNRYAAVTGQARGVIYPEYGDEPGVDTPLPYAQMQISGEGQFYADESGAWSIDLPEGSYSYKTWLRGRWARTDHFLQIDAKRSGTVSTGDHIVIDWDGSKTDKDERNGYYHATRQHDYIKAIDPAFTGTDYQMRVRVGYGLIDNAWYDGLGINFGEGFLLLKNTAEYSDIILHEYTHATTDRLYRPQAPSGAMHEGFSDYWACTVNDDPYLAEGALRRSDNPMRRADTDLRYPEDLTGEPHDDGRIVCAAMWSTRLALGRSLADSLLHFARYLKATNMVDYGTDVLVTDDDDGDLTNGTPHGSRIIQAFSHNGLMEPLNLTLVVPDPPAPVAPGEVVSWVLEVTNGETWEQEVDVYVSLGEERVLVASDRPLPPGVSRVEVAGRVPSGLAPGEYAVGNDVGIYTPERVVSAGHTDVMVVVQ